MLARDATQNFVPPGAMVLQPSDERRRSGSNRDDVEIET
jgi:hypothetical protein